MQLRTLLAIYAGKTTASLLRLAGSGGGALPGLVAEKLQPQLLSLLADQCHDGIVLICGTNGKTTTSRMLAEMLGPDSIVHNRSGSNLARGHLAAFLERTSWKGTLATKQAILEVDEAVLPATLKVLSPRAILLANLFRDQLDRYGEVDSISSKWLESLKQDMPENCTLIVNADDPNLAWLAKRLKHPHTTYYGIDDRDNGTIVSTSPVDIYLSPASDTPLSYATYYLSHLGDYTDGKGFARPLLEYAATDIVLGNGTTPTQLSLRTPEATQPLQVGLPGLYNVYNAVAAACLARVLGIESTRIADTLSSFQSAFGRFERLSYEGREIVLCLIKNPVGASEVLRTLSQETRPFNLALLANDNFADGQDVSWYWDTPYEQASTLPVSVSCGGLRAADLALRLKYAGYKQAITTQASLTEAFDHAMTSSPGVTYVLSTYTASLELQKLLRQRGIKSHYWKE